MVGEGGYEVRVRVGGELSPSWAPVFGSALLVTAFDGTTIIAGRLPDQSAVHGLLTTLRDLGLSLISVHLVALDDPSSDEAPTDAAAAIARAPALVTGRG